MRTSGKMTDENSCGTNRQMCEHGRCPVEVVGGVLRKENLALLTGWGKRKDRKAY